MKEPSRTIHLTAQRLRSFFAACALAGLWALSARAADVKPTDAKPVIDPSADKVLKRMGDYLAPAPFFSVNAEIWQDVELGSGPQGQAPTVPTRGCIPPAAIAGCFTTASRSPSSTASRISTAVFPLRLHSTRR